MGGFGFDPKRRANRVVIAFASKRERPRPADEWGQEDVMTAGAAAGASVCPVGDDPAAGQGKSRMWVPGG